MTRRRTSSVAKFSIFEASSIKPEIEPMKARSRSLCDASASAVCQLAFSWRNLGTLSAAASSSRADMAFSLARSSSVRFRAARYAIMGAIARRASTNAASDTERA